MLLSKFFKPELTYEKRVVSICTSPDDSYTLAITNVNGNTYVVCYDEAHTGRRIHEPLLMSEIGFWSRHYDFKLPKRFTIIKPTCRQIYAI